MYYKLNLILTYFSPAISFLLITGLLLFQIFKKRLPSVKTLSNLIKIFISFLIIFAIVLSVLNYFAWKQNDVSKHLLPPFSPITYVLHYSWQHYLFEPVVVIVAALLLFWLINRLNKRFNNQFFYDEEPYLAALGILTIGWPNCLIYLSLVLFLGIIFHLFRIIFSSFIQKKARDMFFHLIFLFSNSRGENNSLRKVSRRLSGQGSSERSERENETERQAAISSLGKSTASFRASYFRLSLLYFWLPCALLVLLLGGIISEYLITNQFTI